MKEIFFKGVAVALPLVVLGGLIYLVFNGFYQLYADMRLKRELEQIQRESAIRRRQRQAPEVQSAGEPSGLAGKEQPPKSP